jgi:DNA-binding transcriptional MocR family regulator
MLAETTGLSKSAVQTALELLRRRQLIETRPSTPTATPEHRVLRPMRSAINARSPERHVSVHDGEGGQSALAAGR